MIANDYWIKLDTVEVKITKHCCYKNYYYCLDDIACYGCFYARYVDICAVLADKVMIDIPDHMKKLAE